MNYYEHHLGDYLRDTAHLSMIEDGAYRRLIDAYYIRERPLPADLREVYRLVRAQSKQDREAVEVVLREFFQQSPAGWTHKRCDSEIERYKESQEGREAAKDSAKERQRRARERRRELFDALRDHGIVPDYDTPTAELQTLLSRTTSRPVTRDVTCDDTATQTPDTRSSTSLRSVEGARAARLPPGWVPPDNLWQWSVDTLGTQEAAGYELAKFADYWAAKAGAGGARLDWEATWRNWVRKAVEYAQGRRNGGGNGSGNGGRKSAVDRVREANREALEGGGDVLAADDRDLRPPVDERPRRDTHGAVVDGAFRVVG